jgi:O-antigen/teichoic acid export membrane protein
LTALRQVLFQKATETQHHKGNLTALYVKTSGGLLCIALVPTLILFVWAPVLFSFVFGSQWQTAGEFSRGLAIWMLFAFSNLPAALFGRIIRIQRRIFFYDLALLGARTMVLVLGGMYLSALNTVMIFSVVGAGMNLLLILMVGHALMRKEGHANWRYIGEVLAN